MYGQVQFVTQVTARRRFQRSAETIDAACPARACCRASSAGRGRALASRASDLGDLSDQIRTDPAEVDVPEADVRVPVL